MDFMKIIMLIVSICGTYTFGNRICDNLGSLLIFIEIFVYVIVEMALDYYKEINK